MYIKIDKRETEEVTPLVPYDLSPFLYLGYPIRYILNLHQNDGVRGEHMSLCLIQNPTYSLDLKEKL